MKKKKFIKSARQLSRECAVQALYACLLKKENVLADLIQPLKDLPHFEGVNEEFLEKLLNGVLKNADDLEKKLRPFLDREFAQLSPVESSVLLLGAFELLETPETPAPVILNEAIELAKKFGGTDSHKYINGVLDKLAKECRKLELQPR